MNVRALIMAGCILTLGLASCGPKTETPSTTDSTMAPKDTMVTPPMDTTSKPTAADTATSKTLDSAMKKKDTATLLTDSAIHNSKKPETKKPATSTSSKSGSTSSNNNTVGNSTSPTSTEGRRGNTSTGTGTGETQSGRRR